MRGRLRSENASADPSSFVTPPVRTNNCMNLQRDSKADNIVYLQILLSNYSRLAKTHHLCYTLAMSFREIRPLKIRF